MPPKQLLLLDMAFWLTPVDIIVSLDFHSLVWSGQPQISTWLAGWADCQQSPATGVSSIVGPMLYLRYAGSDEKNQGGGSTVSSTWRRSMAALAIAIGLAGDAQDPALSGQLLRDGRAPTHQRDQAPRLVTPRSF